MTAKFVSSKLSCKGCRDRAFKTIQSLYRNQKVQGEMTPNILTQLYKLDLRISPYYVIVSYLDLIRL